MLYNPISWPPAHHGRYRLNHSLSLSRSMRVHITRKSSNKKTGPIPVTTTESASCPPSCPFINAGCYAKSGPLALHWRKVSSGERGTDWQGLCDFVQSLPEHQLWRHNQAGDLPHHHGVIDHAALAHLVVANTGRRGFTYTHHTLTPENVSMLTRSNRQGFTVNASTESLGGADHALSLGLPAVTVVRNDQPVPKRSPAGNRVVVCPAQTRSDVACADCQLCSKADRGCIVAFLAHGTQAKKVNAALPQ